MSQQIVIQQSARVAGVFPAVSFAYGVNPNANPGVLLSGNSATGAGTTIVVRSPEPFMPATVKLADGSWIDPYATTASITVVDANQETVTPTGVAINSDGTVSITGDFTQLHGQGAQIASGTIGLQEAINAAHAAGGGVVVVDGAWVNFGGTQAMINGATLYADVSIQDNRGAMALAYAGSTDAIVFPARTNIAEINATGVDACTLATPGANDVGKLLTITSTTAHAHTVTTAATKIQNGTASPGDTLTFAAFAGATCTLLAVNGFWQVVSLTAVTLSEV